ncbi:MAG TPA: hypothetical protein VNQ77_20070 [Frankiaceae bacterium]|nr:hypothetical protein [Frankiaceae bacterium]
MIEQTRQRLMVLLLLFFVGVAGAVTYAATNESPRKATPAADGQQTGTGTVVGGNGPQSPSPQPGGPGKGNPQGPNGVFYISGQVSGLIPGAPSTLPLTIENPNPWPIQVLTLDTGVSAPAGSPCPASTLNVGEYTYTNGAKISAPARGTVVVNVPVELADSVTQDQSGCPGSSFPLTFTGTAVKTTR